MRVTLLYYNIHMNEKVLTTLEFDKILTRLCAHAATDVGREYAAALRPAETLRDAQTLLDQTTEADGVMRRTGRTPITDFPDVRNLLGRLHAALFVSAGELLDIARVLRASREAKNVLQDGEAEGLLANMANQLSSHRSVEEEIARCIVSEEEISDNASPELSRIRRQMKIVNERVREKLNNMIKSATTQKYLQEPIITMRNGRYALPVKAECRAQVPGLVHDQSGSGATVFIEPAAVVELGNEYKRLLAEEKTEIERVLSGLTALVEPFEGELYGSVTVLGTLDMIFSRAALAHEQDGNCPTLNSDGFLHIVEGRHPLLPKDSVVPVDVWLGDEFNTLIITGPNTGGKTVTLKTVGLLTLMAAAGMYVPADARTKLCVFDRVFADIGDEQSIEQSLSTFSSHMTNTVRILENADAHSLVLLDELGAGTDPVEGAALAQAILESLCERGARTLATTHYSEIKAFALTHPGMQNACMEFDVDRLCPTYRLFVGIPGRSNAFEISRRLGLSEEVIERAQSCMQKKDVAFEQVLSDAETARKRAETEHVEAQRLRLEAEKVQATLQAARDKLEAERAALRAKAREDARKTVAETREQMQELIRSLRAVKNIDQKELERAIQAARDGMRKAEERLEEHAMQREAVGEAPKSVKPGDRELLLKLGSEASVLKPPDAKGEVAVQAGVIKMNVALSDLRLVEKPVKKQRQGGGVQLSGERGPAMELDLRGKMVDEACMEIDRMIDDAAFTGITELTVIHGKGTGALRKGVQEFLRTHPRVKAYRMGAYGEGDAGVTVVTLKPLV